VSYSELGQVFFFPTRGDTIEKIAAVYFADLLRCREKNKSDILVEI